MKSTLDLGTLMTDRSTSHQAVASQIKLCDEVYVAARYAYAMQGFLCQRLANLTDDSPGVQTNALVREFSCRKGECPWIRGSHPETDEGADGMQSNSGTETISSDGAIPHFQSQGIVDRIRPPNPPHAALYPLPLSETAKKARRSGRNCFRTGAMFGDSRVPISSFISARRFCTFHHSIASTWWIAHRRLAAAECAPNVSGAR
jgi:hypothetical protein